MVKDAMSKRMKKCIEQCIGVLWKVSGNLFCSLIFFSVCLYQSNTTSFSFICLFFNLAKVILFHKFQCPSWIMSSSFAQSILALFVDKHNAYRPFCQHTHSRLELLLTKHNFDENLGTLSPGKLFESLQG